MRTLTILALLAAPASAAELKELFTLDGHAGIVGAAVWPHDGKSIIACDDGGNIKQHDVESGKLVRQFVDGHRPGVKIRSLAVGTDGKYLFSGDWDGQIGMWDIASGKFINRSLSAGEPASSLAAIGPTQVVVTHALQNDKTYDAYVWDMKRSLKVGTLRGHKNAVLWGDVAKNGVIATSAGAEIIVWSNAGQPMGKIVGTHKGHIRGLAISPNGQFIASGGSDNVVLLHAINGRFLRGIGRHDDMVRTVAWSPNGKQIASSGSDGVVKVWDLNARELASKRVTDGNVLSVEFNPSGKYISASTSDSRVVVFESPK